MKKTFDFKKADYSVSGVSGIKLTEALQLWKTKFPTFVHFKKAVTKDHPVLKDFQDYVEEIWDSIEKVTAKEAFAQKNAEKRRVYFDSIGVIELFKQVNPELLDKQVIKKKRKRWDDKNDPYDYKFEDVYELYAIDPKQLFKGTKEADSWGFSTTDKYMAVRCWCTTTNREYWLYVPEEACIKDGKRKMWGKELKASDYDAIKAIAWTVRIDITHPEKIYRQGDIIIAKESKDSIEIPPYHLTKDQYLKLMYSET